MNSPNHSELLQRIEALERENELLRQGVRQGERLRRLSEEAIDELQRTKQQLKARNAELTSLHRISALVSETIDFNALFPKIIEAMEEAMEEAAGRQMGIFLVEEDRMHLVFQQGGSAGFVAAHKGMRVGDCLCGLAARSGEAVLSEECCNDPRQTIGYEGRSEHGHLILPLKANGRTVAVFYFYLPCHLSFPPRKLETMAAIGQQIGVAIENARLYEEARSLTLRDALTGVGNRRLLELALDRDIHNARRYERPLSIMMIDIDFFKRYNDTHGHQEGDRLLAQVGALLRSGIREGDLVVRYGGEEFLIMLPETGLEEACVAAERFRRTIEAESGVTASIGVSNTIGNTEPEALIGSADEALYRAKAAGRNRVVASHANGTFTLLPRGDESETAPHCP